MNASELRLEIARLAGLLAQEVGGAEASQSVERIGRRVGLRPPGQPTMAEILKDIAERYECTPSEIIQSAREQPFVFARKAAYAEMTKRGYSQSEIGRFFGRSPSTVHKVLGAMTRARAA